MSKKLVELKKLTKKVLSSAEKRLNTEKARRIAELTHHAGGVDAFFEAANAQLVPINNFTTWKFCNLLHRVLREGPQEAITAALSRWALIRYIGDHQQPSAIGPCIAAYCQLLLKKLHFHQTYPFFRGNLKTHETQGWNVNVCFELCSDVFDYLEALLQVQAVVFWATPQQLIAADSAAAQCRLQPLATIVEECQLLYAHAAQILCYLYAELPAEDVRGLYDRFCVLHQQLRLFYLALPQVSAVIPLLQAPELPEVSPSLCVTPPSHVRNTLYPELPEPSAPLEWELHY